VQTLKQKGVKQVLCVHDMVFWVITMPFAILPPHSRQVWFIGMPKCVSWILELQKGVDRI
jgi:hypothetical protein